MMPEITLPPSPNWYLSSILACASDGTVAWGARNSIVILKINEDSKQKDYSIINKAHNERVTSIAFSPNEENGSYRLVSSGDENIVKIWTLKDLSMELNNVKLDSKYSKVIGVDWSKRNVNIICFLTDDGVLVTWYINYDNSQLMTLGKMTATCLACCPHDENLVAIGSKAGLVYIVDIHGTGSIKYKLRGHDAEIVSVSWCPVPVNVLQETDQKELLLASGAKDKCIFLWRAGTDGRYQKKIAFPNVPMNSNQHKSKSGAAGNYTAVCWLKPMILLTSSPWGELLAWDLNTNKKEKFHPQLVHDRHNRGLFCIAGLDEKSTQQGENDDWRVNSNIKAIWTIAQDRKVICSALINNIFKVNYSIPTQGGFVYCISTYAMESSQIAFGVGDAMIRLWNLSESHETIMELQTLWEKIKGKVRALSWHPTKENLLAFATNEGRVGIFDTNVTKPPILYRQYHRRIIYRIAWGPAPNVKDFALYTCGDGELVYYDPEKVKNNPRLIIKRKVCTECSWKPDYSLLAVGFLDGCISFFDQNLSEYSHKIHTLNKAINCLTWHPRSTTSDFNFSLMQNYLAVAINDATITIFDISIGNNSEEKEYSNNSFYKIVTTLNGHNAKVVCLAWSPHMSGYLVSGSYDCTAQVWKVETQEIIATYTCHSGPIQCCMWSPIDRDIILTGSADFTLRIWNIKNQTVSTASSAAKISMKGKRTKKKKSKEATINNDLSTEIETNLNVSNSELKKLVDNEQELNSQDNSIETEDTNKLQKIKKRKSKKLSHFPGYTEISKDNKLWCSALRGLLKTPENNSQFNDSSVLNNPNEENKTVKSNRVIPFLLGDKENFERALNYEKKILESNEHYHTALDIDFWTSNLKENLQEAMKEKRLNEFLISLAPTISTETWKTMCEAYANQMLFEENPRKAASYFLCINKIHEAIDVYLSSKLHKEAYVLASIKLDSEDPLIEKILRTWASDAYKDGHFQNAAECYIKLGELETAAKVLQRRKDVDSLILSLEIAQIIEDPDLEIALGEKSIYEALLTCEIETANFITKKCSKIKYREIEVEVFSELNKILESVSDETIVNWLKGLSNISLLESISNHFIGHEIEYSLLLNKDILPFQEEEKDRSQKMDKYLQFSVSHQLALSILSKERKQQLQHVIKALDMVLQYEKTKIAVKEDEFPLLIKYLFVLDNKTLMDSNSIFNNDDTELTISLRAYYCYAIINWFQKSKLTEDQISEYINLIFEALEKCVKDLFNKESIEYWIGENEIKQLEQKLAINTEILQNSEEGNTNKTQDIIERLNKLKTDKKQFIDKRLLSPNPLFMYCAIEDFAKKTSNELIRQIIIDFSKNLKL